MISKKRQVLLVVLLFFVLTQSGCASLLQAPFMVVGESFKLIGKVLDLIGKLPTPPPGVF